MAEDRRELILLRILAVLESIAVSDENVFRNKTEIPENRRPGMVLVDGDESRDEEVDPTTRGRPANAPPVVLAMPQIFIVVAEDDSKGVGPALNEWRAKVIKAIMKDAELVALCLTIRYDGFTNALAMGRTMQSQGHLNFTFRYILRIDQL